MKLEQFEYSGSPDETMPDDMGGWFEVYDAEEENAWIASDTTMEVEA